MFGQVPVGMAGGSPGGGAMPGFDSAMSKLTKQAGAKPTIDSLPDKVKFIYSEKATQFEEISLLVYCIMSTLCDLLRKPQFYVFNEEVSLRTIYVIFSKVSFFHQCSDQ